MIEEAVTAKYPPCYEGINREIISIGDDSHWMKLFDLKLWIFMVVWKEQCKRHTSCASVKKDPKTTKGIIHIDAYPVHISEAFISWIKKEFPMFLLCYVPANCTSVMQIADVALNRPLKAQCTNQHMLRLMSDFKKQRADGVAV